jgi:hypothetical protein
MQSGRTRLDLFDHQTLLAGHQIGELADSQDSAVAKAVGTHQCVKNRVTAEFVGIQPRPVAVVPVYIAAEIDPRGSGFEAGIVLR